jgi:arginase
VPGPWHLIEAGVATAARYAGMTEAPQALIAQLAALASPAKHVRIPFVPRETYLRAAREACMTLCDTVSATLGDGGRPLILGGECSIVAGSVPAAYATIPELTLVYLDAHGDFNTLATTPSHFFGGMCLAHVCGRPVGPLLWPGVRMFPEAQVCLVGARDLDPGERGNLERSLVRRFSFDAAIADPPGLLATVRGRPIFVHIDLDVVDPAEMSAVNFPAPGGVSFASLTLVLASLARVAQVEAVEVCGYDAKQDPERALVRDIVDSLAPLLSERQASRLSPAR